MQDLTVSECIALINSSLDQTILAMCVIGELANYRISKGRWVYFELKDEDSIIKFFGNINNISYPIDEGMLLRVVCMPKLHNKYGFSLNIVSLKPFGEGSIKKSIELLKLKLEKEGIFDPLKKKEIPYPPSRIALITSTQSAAYSDFIKILSTRWSNTKVDVVDVLVQGYETVGQITNAIMMLNQNPEQYDVIVVIRGGGSPEDLAAFNDEKLTRVIFNSKIPTLVAIGHEIDVCLAELAADQRASTPSNAAELIVPDYKIVMEDLNQKRINLRNTIKRNLQDKETELNLLNSSLLHYMNIKLNNLTVSLNNKAELLDAYNPIQILKRGYSIVKFNNKVVSTVNKLKRGDILEIKLYSGKLDSKIIKLSKGN